MSKVIEITKEKDFKDHLSSLPPTALLIVSFYAPWAAPCAQMATVLNTLATSYPATTPPETSWISLNAEDLPDISEEYNVTAVPFLVLVRNDTVLETVSGSDATKVRAAIERYANARPDPLRPAEVPVDVHIHEKKPAQNLSGYASSKGDADTTLKNAPEDSSKDDLTKRLELLVKAAPVMLFMKGTPKAPQCGFSRQLVALLRERSIRYGFFNILADDEVRQGLKEFADWPTFPQLWVDGELVGGLDIVKEEMANDPDFLKEYAVKSPTAPAAETA
jgi:Grx4 family monothiol glutaredoxin